MARNVQCRRYGEELEGLERPPLPGAKGQDIFDNVSKKAWLEWQSHQTMLFQSLLEDTRTCMRGKSSFPLQQAVYSQRDAHSRRHTNPLV